MPGTPRGHARAKPPLAVIGKSAMGNPEVASRQISNDNRLSRQCLISGRDADLIDTDRELQR
jgi:hypothetical protein